MSSLIYVADDEPALRDLYREALELSGHRFAVFPDGESLLAAVNDHAPDLILLDINMPGISGWEVHRRLASDPAFASIPVIAVTAQGGAAVETSALRTLKVSAFVRKPFRLGELLDAVRKNLRT